MELPSSNSSSFGITWGAYMKKTKVHCFVLAKARSKADTQIYVPKLRVLLLAKPVEAGLMCVIRDPAW